MPAGIPFFHDMMKRLQIGWIIHKIRSYANTTIT